MITFTPAIASQLTRRRRSRTRAPKPLHRQSHPAPGSGNAIVLASMIVPMLVVASLLLSALLT
jgi:hypothetical protein